MCCMGLNRSERDINQPQNTVRKTRNIGMAAGERIVFRPREIHIGTEMAEYFQNKKSNG